MFTVNGIAVNTRVEGNARAPWVTFITGIANDLTMWNGQVSALERDFRILRYDLRGHGASQATPPPYTIELLAADLLALWDAAGVEKRRVSRSKYGVKRPKPGAKPAAAAAPAPAAPAAA